MCVGQRCPGGRFLGVPRPAMWPAQIPKHRQEEGRGYRGDTSCSQPLGWQPAVCQWLSHPKKLLCSAVQQTDWGRGSRPAAGWWQTLGMQTA